MKDDLETCGMICSLPTEVLLYIFTFLSGKDLVKCRQICKRWKSIIDELMDKDYLWYEYCKRDYSDVYQIARYKARIGVVWFNIYRCLSLWPRLSTAREVQDEFAPATNSTDELQNFEILPDGIIGVHKRNGIYYYNAETLEPTKRRTIRGSYARYAETMDHIIILNYQLHLFVIRKVLYGQSYSKNDTFVRVKLFFLHDHTLSFVNLDNEIFSVNLDDKDLKGHLMARSEYPIMNLGYKDKKLYALTFERNLYLVENNTMKHVLYLDGDVNVMDVLLKYNILQEMDWRVYNQWMCILRRKIPESPLTEIVTVRKYGDIFFVGCTWGVVRIYYKPYTNGELDLYSAEPVKQYNYMERTDVPILTTSTIIKVDVLESTDGHRVLICMPKKIAVVDFIYSFKRTASVALLPYNEVQKVKLLKLYN